MLKVDGTCGRERPRMTWDEVERTGVEPHETHDNGLTILSS